MRKLVLLFALLFGLSNPAHATIFGTLEGVVHDPQHRPISSATVTLKAANSAFTITLHTSSDGTFSIAALALGEYAITVTQPGFSPLTQAVTLASNTSAILHFELQLPSLNQAIVVLPTAQTAPDSATPTTTLSRIDIASTPGADRAESLAAITDFVPGAYITHDQLHIRGGHQVTWQIDGVPIPNTNIASNLGAQIAPRDIDYLEIQRGSYSADVGDRTYGVFNVVPRSGFERARTAEVVLTAGSFLQTDDQVNFGDHSENAAYYASFSGNRSEYGLSPPIAQPLHDATSGFGGFASLIDNLSPKNQLRLVTQLRTDFFQIPYDPDPNSIGNQQYQSSGLRDTQRETDALAAFTYVHTFSPATVLQLSPFFHLNQANYTPASADQPVATASDRTSNYAGAQAQITSTFQKNTVQAGLFSFGQHDSYRFGAIFNDASSSNFSIPDRASGGVVEAFLSDTSKLLPSLTLTAGLRQTHFTGSFAEDSTSPRIGLALDVPRLNWTFRAFYGRFYQPPPLLTAAGPIVDYAAANNTAFAPLHGERDEEHQFGVQIPLPGRLHLAGWILDADTFKTRANNFLDHSNVGESSLYYPVTIQGALIRGWELTLRSPRLPANGHAHLAYSNQIAQQRGAITGGLVCEPIGSPACVAGFTYRPVDHDQRNTLSVGYSTALPLHTFASTNISYGSGFTNGAYDPANSSPVDPQYPNPYLPSHSSADFALGANFGNLADALLLHCGRNSSRAAEGTTLSVNAINLGNSRTLLDNSLTFGGFHYSDPRQIYAELRFHIHY